MKTRYKLLIIGAVIVLISAVTFWVTNHLLSELTMNDDLTEPQENEDENSNIISNDLGINNNNNNTSDETEELIRTLFVSEESQEDLDEKFPMDISEKELRDVIHGMSHQKVLAEKKWVFELMTAEKIDR